MFPRAPPDRINYTEYAVKKEVDRETKEIIDSFVAEGYERLDDAEVHVEKMGCTDDSDCLGSIFRLFHSVKGSAGYLGFENVKLSCLRRSIRSVR
jgi:two-component system chemotaxis sensor kinase CheA